MKVRFKLLPQAQHWVTLPLCAPQAPPYQVRDFYCGETPPNPYFTSESGPCVLRLWTVNGKMVHRVSLLVQICSLAYTCAPEGVCENVLVGGMADGTI